MLTENHEEREAAIEADMLQHSQLYRQLTVQGRVVPALNQITSEHNIRVRDLGFLVRNKPFIPPGHEGIFQKGFYAGFTSDFVTAAHLLVPQVENSIRYVLTQAGKITSGINAQMVQEEHDINRLLEWPEVKNIFGEALVFDLKGLLISRFGANFRNRLAHGLIPDVGFYAVESVYTWWLLLKICVLPIIQIQDEAPTPTEKKP